MASAAANATSKFLTISQVSRLHNTFVYKIAQPSQAPMPESAVNSPINIDYYESQTNLFQLAANLAEKIMKNHSYQDENKRTAYVAANMFLKINGYQLEETPTASMADAHVVVCTNIWTAEELGRYYESNARAIPGWSDCTKEYT
ncbi:Uncharacterized protein BP5553_00935 [Venustampulla echinocandica]|uniref:Fido domain-containing protein n=1 Tax=Venustampulla echinocandica TaxID=2656787 RepID=A0A370TZJ6_9HELO|nr:Uncharacterized protein BP5553_00935 [Venustampulla echinocandica]RDL40956.1 Uncharacterized protein BP5553_00935 [Venustampulla echinocandica]